MTDDPGGSEGDDNVEYGLDDWSDDAGEELSEESGTVTSAFGGEDSTGGDDSTGGWLDGATDPDTAKVVVAGAFVGALVSSIIPVVGTVLGGAVAGHLGDGDGRSGAVLGGIAGFLSTIPGAIFFAASGDLPQILASIAGGDTWAIFELLIVGFSLLVLDAIGAAFGTVFGAVGGYAGGAGSEGISRTFFETGGESDRSD